MGSSLDLASELVRGKNRTKRNSMTMKQLHCTPICAIPNTPATHSKPLNSWQHARSRRLVGRVKILAKAQVPDVVPRRTKYGERPVEDRREMMR